MLEYVTSKDNSIFFKIKEIDECLYDYIIEYFMQYRPFHENIEIIYDLEYLSKYKAYLIEATLYFKDNNLNIDIEEIIETERINIEKYYN